MEKIDLAVASYRKPESLIYTILSLHRQCGRLIDVIYIDDDCSGPECTGLYTDGRLQKAVEPSRVRVRVNSRRAGYGRTIVTARMVRNSAARWLLRGLKGGLHDENDVRYQWAINSTDKPYLFVMHDDIRFGGDIVSVYLDAVRMRDDIAIAGDLGQCWRCLEGRVCSPASIMQGRYPHGYWPLTTSRTGALPRFYERDCRINEWCCMLNVGIARKITESDACYFGNYEDGGDVGAYWFSKIIGKGYGFVDPLPDSSGRNRYYDHGWQGHSGHSVWVDQGTGRSDYAAGMIRELLKEEFDYEL
jgi:hypothetical protein